MARTSFNDKVAAARAMVAGLTVNLGSLSTVGITQEFVDNLKASLDETTTLDEQQEHLKVQQKLATDALHDKLKELETKLSKAQKLVKAELPQRMWSEFGIEAKR